MSASVEQTIDALEAALENRDDIPDDVTDAITENIHRARVHLHLCVNHVDIAAMRLERVDHDKRLPGVALHAELN